MLRDGWALYPKSDETRQKGHVFRPAGSRRCVAAGLSAQIQVPGSGDLSLVAGVSDRRRRRAAREEHGLDAFKGRRILTGHHYNGHAKGGGGGTSL